jgi:hypothetical protein
LPFGKLISLERLPSPVSTKAVRGASIADLSPMISDPFSTTITASVSLSRMPPPERVRSPHTWYSVYPDRLTVSRPAVVGLAPGLHVTPG